MEFIGFNKWHKNLSNLKHLIIAGPCSAESREQIIDTALQIDKIPQVNVFRAGIWKPRTNPGTFEGVGKPAFEWLNEVKQKTNLLTTIEVATPKHVEIALKNNIDILWIGARTTVNPFSVQAIADAAKGVDIPILIKNPVNPDLKLWIGAIQRFSKVGIHKIAVIHRGFFPFEDTKFRNIPKWELMIELKTQFPDLQIINDPSHIAGQRSIVPEVAQMALNMNVNGLMIETHNNPNIALSDAKQQLTPTQLSEMIKNLIFRKNNTINVEQISPLEHLRNSIDSIDFQLLELLAKRMKIVQEIGEYKNKNKLSIFQLDRWKNIRNSRFKAGKELKLNEDFVKKILQLIHNESINVQSKINIKKNK